MHYNELLEEAGIFSLSHAREIGLSRYMYEQARYHNNLAFPWVRLLELRAGRAPGWKGFKIGHGVIECSNGDRIESFELEKFRWVQQLAFERLKTEKLPNQLPLEIFI